MAEVAGGKLVPLAAGEKVGGNVSLAFDVAVTSSDAIEDAPLSLLAIDPGALQIRESVATPKALSKVEKSTVR